jgi:hypothetical protein
VVVAIAAWGCGGGGGGGGHTTPPTPVIQVAGTYPTAVALLDNDCGTVTVQPNTTTVGHTPGAARLTLTHAALTYNGSLAGDGGFSTDPLEVRDADGSSLTIRISGRFTLTGFDATVAVDVARTTGSRCRYQVRWTGTKQGGPNVLP